MAEKWTKILFVDDDTQLLGLLRQVISNYSNDAWEIYTAPDAVDALSILQEQGIQLLVIDLHMPTVSGLQFLKLLQRRFPDLLKVILTADASDQERGACLEAGAELYLQKPQVEGGWRSIYAALAELVKFQPRGAGSQRVLRAVGMQDVLQMECLAGKSSVLEVFSGPTGGKIFIEDGKVVHAVTGELRGEEAAFHLLALTGAESRLHPFTPPDAQTIDTSWQALLTEAARWKAEQRRKEPQAPDQPAKATAAQLLGETEVRTGAPAEGQKPPKTGLTPAPGLAESQPELRPKIEEILICSPAGEVVYEWQCAQAESRINFLEFLSQKARQIGHGLPLGHLERVETRGADGRTVTRIGPERAVFVRARHVQEK